METCDDDCKISCNAAPFLILKCNMKYPTSASLLYCLLPFNIPYVKDLGQYYMYILVITNTGIMIDVKTQSKALPKQSIVAVILAGYKFELI